MVCVCGRRSSARGHKRDSRRRGGTVGRYVPELWLKRGAGAIFIVLGTVYLFAQSTPSAPEKGGPSGDGDAVAGVRGEAS